MNITSVTEEMNMIQMRRIGKQAILTSLGPVHSQERAVWVRAVTTCPFTLTFDQFKRLEDMLRVCRPGQPHSGRTIG